MNRSVVHYMTEINWGKLLDDSGLKSKGKKFLNKKVEEFKDTQRKKNPYLPPKGKDVIPGDFSTYKYGEIKI